jgi:hypothetical protein
VGQPSHAGDDGFSAIIRVERFTKSRLVWYLGIGWPLHFVLGIRADVVNLSFMKRILFLMLAVMALALVGCGSETTDQTSPPATNAPAK